ncbi:hypothetical protein [Amycolatopsis sp.]|uniref:hypothetical protein n=1 Tax=Amycolatopsis sp. TaxID=37632 RepID=UPI002C5056EB|nr:hypothetical protein [Amycolatopsis sp.]HVV09508.1 hypothetical protein [Amycolatopsis sp.]
MQRVASVRKVELAGLAVIAEVTRHHNTEASEFELGAALHLEATESTTPPPTSWSEARTRCARTRRRPAATSR